MNANPRIFLACLVTTAALTGCTGVPTPATPSPVVVSSPATAFGGTDRSWIEINVAMDEQLLPLLGLIGPDSALHEVAEQVRAFTDAELAELRRLHDEAGLPAENPHKGMPMPGMVTPADVTEATTLRGKELDTMLRECLRAHLEQGRKLAESERTAGVEPRTVALAARIVETRQATLSRL